MNRDFKLFVSWSCLTINLMVIGVHLLVMKFEPEKFNVDDASIGIALSVALSIWFSFNLGRLTRRD